MILLDGSLGTELAVRGVLTPPPRWSAHALDTAPQAVQAIHRDYAAAGVNAHTTATFRTTQRAYGNGWRDAVDRAVALARSAAESASPLGGSPLIAGSIAPLEDCYRPDLSPPNPGPEHRQLARALVQSGVDVLLCETFAHIGEALSAVDAALATGRPTWLALSAGYRADLLTPDQLARGAREAVRLGVSAVLVNCVPASRTLAYVERLADLGVPFGAYANAGDPALGVDPPARYADLAESWHRAGASLLGGCCGTGPTHIRALAQRLNPR